MYLTIVYLALMIGPCGNSGNFMIHSFCMNSFSEWFARRPFFVYVFVVTAPIRCIYPNECNSFDSNSNDTHKIYFECVFSIQVSFVGRFCRTILPFCSQSITHSLCISSNVQTNMIWKNQHDGEKKRARRKRTCIETIRLTDTDS